MKIRFLRFCIALCVLLVPFSLAIAQDNSEIAGIWRTQGYGWVLDIAEDGFTAYQVTEATCVVFDDSDTVDYQGDSVTISGLQFPGLTGLVFGSDAFDMQFTLEDADTFIFDTESVAPIYAHRIDSLPESCADGIEDSDDPETIFEIFWHMFNEHYAFFELHGVDWQAVYDTYRPQITANTSGFEIHEIIVEILSSFSDGHVNFLSIYGFHNAGTPAAWTNNEDEETLSAYIRLIIENYLIDEPVIVANNKIVYGRLSETTGYINIVAMYEYSEDGDDIAALEAVMPGIMAEFADLENIVVDVRFNGGGDDRNAVHIAGYFTDEPYVGFSKQTWTGDDFTDLYDVTVEPAGEQAYTGNVYFLTSDYTLSGAEVFTLNMSALPNVTTVGEATGGALSDILPVFFPNGWFATISNERYLSHDGVLYEGTGIPADIEVPMSLEALENGYDPVIDTVLELTAD